MRLYRVRRYLERTGGEQTRTARAYYQRHQRARRSVMAEAVVFKVCLKKMKKEKKKSSGCSFWVQCVPHWQLVCVCVGVTPACTVACLHVLILWCLLIEWRGGWHKASWDPVHRACQLLSLSHHKPPPPKCKTETGSHSSLIQRDHRSTSV